MDLKPRFVLLIDIGSTFTKVTGVDLETEQVLGTSKAHTTIRSNVCNGLSDAMELLHQSIGEVAWDLKLACSSAAGGLGMIAVGLVESLTVRGAKEAALSAGAKLLGSFSGQLNTDEVEEIRALKPDIILLSGGTDGGNKKVVIANAARLAKADLGVPIIFAGNKSAKPMVEKIMTKWEQDVVYADNVMPKVNHLDIASAKEAIADMFIREIIQAKGISEAMDLIDDVMMPTPLAVMEGAKLLAEGTDDESGIGELLVIDVGGATTDVHSVCEGVANENNIFLKGIKEPYVKRTVEGDLGARISLKHTVEHFGEEHICKALQIERSALDDLLLRVEQQPDHIGLTGSMMEQLDELLSEYMVYESVRRHGGTMSEVFTPAGRCYEQEGKDLRSIKHILGTGGPLIYRNEPVKVLYQAVKGEKDTNQLVPEHVDYYLDQLYILSSMGLLSRIAPNQALRILKKNIEKLS